jgi:hypothetical protein
MKNFALVRWDDLSRLKHAMANDRMALHKIELHLRDWHRTGGDVQQEVVYRVIEEMVDFNVDRLGKTMDILGDIILTNDRRKKRVPVEHDRRGYEDTVKG